MLLQESCSSWKGRTTPGRAAITKQETCDRTAATGMSDTKKLRKKAIPEKESLDWEPMGSLAVENVLIKEMRNCGAKLTLKMFWLVNHDMQSRACWIIFNQTDHRLKEPTFDFKEPREAWQVVEALNIYTLCLLHVRPEDWAGHALQRILIQDRWLSGCNKSRATQATIMVAFINQVLSTNASRGRSMRAPLSYKQIEDVLAERMWKRGVIKAKCSGGRNPCASSNILKPKNPSPTPSLQTSYSTHSGQTPGASRGPRGNSTRGRGGTAQRQAKVMNCAEASTLQMDATTPTASIATPATA